MSALNCAYALRRAAGRHVGILHHAQLAELHLVAREPLLGLRAVLLEPGRHEPSHRRARQEQRRRVAEEAEIFAAQSSFSSSVGSRQSTPSMSMQLFDSTVPCMRFHSNTRGIGTISR